MNVYGYKISNDVTQLLNLVFNILASCSNKKIKVLISPVEPIF